MVNCVDLGVDSGVVNSVGIKVVVVCIGVDNYVVAGI